MTETPHIVDTPALLTAYIPLRVPRADIRDVMGPGIQEVYAAVTAQGLTPTGPWFTHHLRMDPEIFDFEICVPIAARVRPVGRVLPGELAAATVARTVYSGPYEGLGDAWSSFVEWIEAAGYTPAPSLWECYLTGPATHDDPAAWRTELNRPLLR